MHARTSTEVQYHEIEPKGLLPYRTPWCDMLGCLSGKTMDIVHLYYPLAHLQEEIHKRTSYLGKHRGTNAAPHLLDLIAMTKDESDLFHSFARSAMMKVFEPLSKHTRHVEKAYLWEVNCHTVTLTHGAVPPQTYSKGDYVSYRDTLYLATGAGDSDTLENLAPTPDFRESIHYIIQWEQKLNHNDIEPLDQAVQDALTYYIIWQWLLSAYTDDAKTYQVLYLDAIEMIKKLSQRTLPSVTYRIPRVF